VIITATTQQQQQQQHHLNQQQQIYEATNQTLRGNILTTGSQIQLSSHQTNSLTTPRHQAQPATTQYALYQPPAIGADFQQRQLATIYDAPRQLQRKQQSLVRNQSIYLTGDGRDSSPLRHQQMISQNTPMRTPQNGSSEKRSRALNSELFERLEVIEKQIDLRREMELVERHSIVITRALDPYTLMPHLTQETLRQYQTHFLLSDDYVIRFIEIIKRPGQTLGLYIRNVQFENPNTRTVREGLVITKIESDSPIYTSKVIHAGDEILSINLIDVRGMNLDDVVILMSIPKRLVLALRIPKDRDQIVEGPARIDEEGVFDEMIRQQPAEVPFGRFVAPSRANRPPMNQMDAVSNGLEQLPTVAGDLAVGLPHDNFLSNLNTAPGHQHPRSEISESNRPVRVHSAMEINALGEQRAELARLDVGMHFRHNKETEDLISEIRDQVRPLGTVSRRQQGSDGFDHRAANLIQDSSRCTPDPVPIGSQIVGGEQRRVSDDLLHGPREQTSGEHLLNPDDETLTGHFSLDPEIASLEREAMSKERPMARMQAIDRLQSSSPISKENKIISPDGKGAEASANYLTKNLQLSSSPRAPTTSYLVGTASSLNRAPDRTSSTLPRRVLPTLPTDDKDGFIDSPPTSSSQNYNSTSNPSTLRRPLLNNIRLGSTSEQTSYFSSSIDAINRELKELRRQRMALDNENQVKSNTNTPISNNDTISDATIGINFDTAGKQTRSEHMGTNH